MSKKGKTAVDEACRALSILSRNMRAKGKTYDLLWHLEMGAGRKPTTDEACWLQESHPKGFLITIITTMQFCRFRGFSAIHSHVSIG